MVIVRCTFRLLKLLAPNEISDVAPASDDWYANLLWIDRRKCLLLVHADTLFPVFVADVRKPQLANFGQCAAGTVATALADEGFPADRLGSLDPRQVQVARTASRHVLGVMNDMASMTEHIVQQRGGLRELDAHDHQAFLRSTPNRRDGRFIRPIDAAREREAPTADSS
jgi:hypothetical protein